MMICFLVSIEDELHYRFFVIVIHYCNQHRPPPVVTAPLGKALTQSETSDRVTGEVMQEVSLSREYIYPLTFLVQSVKLRRRLDFVFGRNICESYFF